MIFVSTAKWLFVATISTFQVVDHQPDQLVSREYNSVEYTEQADCQATLTDRAMNHLRQGNQWIAENNDHVQATMTRDDVKTKYDYRCVPLVDHTNAN